MEKVPEVMDIRRAAEYLGISHQTLYQYLQSALMPAFKLGNRWRIKKSVLDGWMEKQSEKSKKRPLDRTRAASE
jgi:excisionase family DNA binding protein